MDNYPVKLSTFAAVFHLCLKFLEHTNITPKSPANLTTGITWRFPHNLLFFCSLAMVLSLDRAIFH